MIQRRICYLQHSEKTKRRLKDSFNERRRPILVLLVVISKQQFQNTFLVKIIQTNHTLLIPLVKLRNGRDSFLPNGASLFYVVVQF